MYFLAEGAISWKSAKQALIKSSTIAAEYIAYYKASNHRNWMQNVVTNLKVAQELEDHLSFIVTISQLLCLSITIGA